MDEFDESLLYDQYEIDEKYFPAAERDIRQLYENNKDGIYYTRQLQIKFEKTYFPWITYRVIRYLNDLAFLRLIERPQKDATSINFYTHYSNRYPKRKINKLEEIIREFSQDHITRSCGQRAEDLFCLGLVKKGFKVTGQKVKEYNGKKWTKTGHDLDFVFEKDGICYGCEIKNTLGCIGKEELDIKIKMCEFFKIRPLFIMRHSPKHYNKEIITKGGFVLIFETQIYELSQIKLVEKIKENLGLPVMCSKAIPEGIIDRFHNWHKRQILGNSK